ncbi:MAG: glycosyltransferase family 4 protein, partial [Bacteroidetes bacterium]|nr:glycosyltransferase family 4 protein [Bacteroidota bacterium]
PRYLSVKALEAKVEKWRPNITHVTGDVHFLMWGIPRGKRVLTIHDIGFLRSATGLKYQLLRHFWLTGPVRKAHAITCVSTATKNEVLRHLPRARRIEVIPTVIDPRFVRHDKPFNEARPTILLLGSAPNKNLHRVLKATQGLDVHLSIVAKLDAFALELLEGQSYAQCESISFEALLEQYRQADILAMCSTHEGFGMPILEAQATGRVVLTSNCSSMPDVAGSGALLIDPLSVKSIREGLERLCSDAELRTQLIEEGFKNTQRFLPEEVAKKYLALYRRLVPEDNK